MAITALFVRVCGNRQIGKIYFFAPTKQQLDEAITGLLIYACGSYGKLMALQVREHSA